MVDRPKKIMVFAFTVVLITIWVVLFGSESRLWDFAAGLLLACGILPVMWALVEKESDKLSLGIALLVLLGIAWLVWVGNASVFVFFPLLVLALAAVKWALSKKTRPARLLGFFVKTFALFLIGTSIAYLIWLGISEPYTYSTFPINMIFETGMLFIFPISLLLEAISIIIYGLFWIRLKPWEIFLSSFYVTALVSLTILIWMSRAPSSHYYSSASAIGAFMWHLLLSLLIASITAGVLTAVYAILKKE